MVTIAEIDALLEKFDPAPSVVPWGVSPLILERVRRDGIAYGLMGPATAEEMTPSEVKW